MSTVAEQLRQAREAKNLTVYQVAEITKIRTDHIRALDEGDFDVFSAPVYVRGFVRTYATLVKADVPAVLAQLAIELSKSAKHHEPPPLMKPKRGILDAIMYQLSKLNWRVVGPLLAVILVALVGFLAYRAWSTHKTKAPLTGLGPGAYQPAKKPGGETLPLPPQRR